MAENIKASCSLSFSFISIGSHLCSLSANPYLPCKALKTSNRLLQILHIMITWNNLWTHVAAAEQKQLWQCLRLDWKHPTCRIQQIQKAPPNVWAKRFQRTLWIVRCQAPPAFDSEQSWCWNKRTLAMTMQLRCQSWYAWCCAACAQIHPQKQSIALPHQPFVVQFLQCWAITECVNAA